LGPEEKTGLWFPTIAAVFFPMGTVVYGMDTASVPFNYFDKPACNPIKRRSGEQTFADTGLI